MLNVTIKLPEEINLEKKLRNPLDLTTFDDPKQKYQFFRNKIKDFINYHLDYEKFNKKLISESALEELKKLETEDLPVKAKSKIRYQEPEKSEEFKIIRENLTLRVLSLEKIGSSVKNIQRLVENISKSEDLSKISYCNQACVTVQESLSKELDNFQMVLSNLDTFYQKQCFDLSNLKKELNQKHHNDLETLKLKFENKIKALVQHNKALSSKKHDTKLQQVYKEKIESLEELLKAAGNQISEKNEQIKQKGVEIASLKQYIDKENEEIASCNKKIKDLESLVSVQQESYHSQIYDLTSEIARIKNNQQDSAMSYQLEVSQLKYVAESSKNRLEQVLLELNACGEQFEFFKEQSKEREKALEHENTELRNEIERLDRIVMSLKEELDSQEIQKNNFKQQNDQNEYLASVISKLERENNQLLAQNKELFQINQTLESEMIKSRDSRSLKTSKSEKKIRKK